jgi:hypothetical protein
MSAARHATSSPAQLKMQQDNSEDKSTAKTSELSLIAKNITSGDRPAIHRIGFGSTGVMSDRDKE